MKTKLHYYLILSFALAFAVPKANAQQLIQFWDFNQTRPFAAAGDSLGTYISYNSGPSNDSTASTWPLTANYVQTPLTPGHIVYSRPNHKVSIATKRDSIIDNGAGGSYYYDYSSTNYAYYNHSDTNGIGGNMYIRTRNPSDSCFMYLFIPTNGFKNIQLQYAISASSTSGEQYNVFAYSTNGISGPWLPLTIGMDTFQTHGVYHYDTLVMVNTITAASGWYPVQITFTSVPAVNNNPNFILRMMPTGAKSTGTSGNDRYDNFAIWGSCNITTSASASPTSPCVATGTATVTPAGGNSPYTYSWITSPVQTNATATGLSTGSYTVNVSDNSGCSSTASVTVTPLPLVTATATVNVNAGECNPNGKATVSPSGGNSPYTYSWNPGGQTNIQATGLSAGAYTVTVKDINGCIGTASITITAPPLIIATATVTSNASGCNANGIAGERVVNGSAPYTYLWNPGGQTNANASSLSAGIYTLTVTDANSCSASSSITITAPPVVTVSASVTAYPTECAATGSASSSASGGSLPYTYLWTPGGQVTPTAINLSGGIYNITIHDNNGCAGSANVTITQPTALMPNATTTANVNCNGGTNGSVLSTPAGGTSPYTYAWSGGGTNAPKTGLVAGTYTITVTDHNNCTATATAIVTQPNLLTVSAATIQNVSCFGDGNGIDLATPSGGTSPYTYSWSGGGTNSYKEGLIPGTYTVSVTDVNSCVASASATITQPTPLIASARVTANVKCNGSNNGSATTSVSGGTSPYAYLWSNGQTTANTSGLSAGTYALTVTDNNGCITIASVAITQPALLTIAASTSANINCFGSSNGKVSSTAGGGASPYTYSWSGSAGTAAAASSLSPGIYTITVTDNNSCSTSASTTVTQPAAALSLTPVVIPNTGSSNCNGKAYITVTGGTSPYTYSWDNRNHSTTDTIKNQCDSTYCCTVTDNNGCVSSVCATIMTGIQSISSSSSISIYPNPTNGQFTIQWAAVTGQWSVEVYNVLGEKVFSQFTIHNAQFTIDLGSQANGMYLVRILNSDGSLATQKKIVKAQ